MFQTLLLLTAKARHCHRRVDKYVHYKYMSLLEIIRINLFRSIFICAYLCCLFVFVCCMLFTCVCVFICSFVCLFVCFLWFCSSLLLGLTSVM